MLMVISVGQKVMSDTKRDKNISQQSTLHNHKRNAVSLITKMKPIQFNLFSNFLNCKQLTMEVYIHLILCFNDMTHINSLYESGILLVIAVLTFNSSSRMTKMGLEFIGKTCFPLPILKKSTNIFSSFTSILNLISVNTH